MGLCQEDATENVCAQVLQLVGIGSPSDAASDYIVKGNNILAIEPNFIKLDDAHLADFLLQLAVLVDGKATTGYLYMVVAVDNSGQPCCKPSVKERTSSTAAWHSVST